MAVGMGSAVVIRIQVLVVTVDSGSRHPKIGSFQELKAHANSCKVTSGPDPGLQGLKWENCGIQIRSHT